MLLVANYYSVSANLDRAAQNLGAANQRELSAADYIAMAQVHALMAIAESMDARLTLEERSGNR